jgi:hypothetical protein
MMYRRGETLAIAILLSLIGVRNAPLSRWLRGSADRLENNVIFPAGCACPA